MERFWRWLSTAPSSPGEIILIVISAIVFCLLYSLTLYSTGFFDGDEESEETKEEPEWPTEIHLSALEWFFIALMLLGFAAFEELVFRVLPLFFAVGIGGHGRRWLIFLTMISSSVIFGYAHFGFASIFVQGIHGFVWCTVFLKCGGLNRRYLHGWMACTIGHFIYNFIVIGVSFILKTPL